MPAFLTIKQFAERYGLTERAALAMVNGNQIPALNMATAGKKSGKPRWRIRESDLPEFEAARTTRAVEPSAPKVAKNRNSESGSVQFFRAGKRVRA